MPASGAPPPASAPAKEAATPDAATSAKSKKSRARRLSYVLPGAADDGTEDGPAPEVLQASACLDSPPLPVWALLTTSTAQKADDDETGETAAQAQAKKNTRARRLSYVTDSVRTAGLQRLPAPLATPVC